MSTAPTFEDRHLTSWRDIVEAAEYLTGHDWVFRGQECAEWPLKTSLERVLGPEGAGHVEVELLTRFIRTAPRLLPAHLVPRDDEEAAWLGLIQHYGGPTRLLDVTRSPFVALFFAFEPTGAIERAVWAIDHLWCMAECARAMSIAEAKSFEEVCDRTSLAQAQLVHSVIHGTPHPSPLFATFEPFTGVFSLDPWKPDARQSAQQAMFLCVANARLSFMQNLAAYPQPKNEKTAYRFTLPAWLRDEALERLSLMNVTAATLFPDLGGLARSLRTHTIRRKLLSFRPPWEGSSTNAEVERG